MAVFTTPFTTPANYTYDSNKIEVSGGLATLSEDLSNVYARWHMNESSGLDVPDDSGNGRDGIRVGSPLWVSGKINNCLSFDGSQYVNCGDVANFDRFDAFSLEAWIKTSGTNNVIVSRTIRSGTYRGWFIRLDSSGRLEIFMISNATGSNYIQVRGNIVINNNVWHHVVMTYDGSGDAVGVTMYIDGSPESETIVINNLSTTIVNVADCNIAGGDNGSESGLLWVGDIDEVVIYNRVITQDEAIFRYNSDSGREDFYRYNDEPTIYKTVGNSDTIFAFNSFLVTEGIVEGSLRYQLSSDGVTWYYWDGGVWSVAGSTDYNIAVTVNANISSFPTGPDKIYVKTFFISDGTQRVEIDEFQITYISNEAPLVNAGSNKSCKDGQTIKSFSDCTFSDPDGCYSDDTEILTENGWRLLKDIVENKEKIKIATLNPENHYLEYDYPVNYFEYDYTGKMLHLKGGSIDCLVTPNHNVYLRRRKDKEWEFIKARDIKFRGMEYKKNCNWEGKEQEYFFIPSIIHTTSNKYSSSEKSISSKQIKMDDWLRFFGIWLAEGSVYYAERPRSKANRILKNGKEASFRKEHIVAIAQNNEENRKLIGNWVRKVGFNCCENGNEHSRNIVIYNKQLTKYLMPIKGAKNKYIPSEYKKLSKRQLWILFDSMMLGDGHKGKTWFYVTSSKQLAYDFEEIALKIGFVTNVSIYEGLYTINLSKKQLTPKIRKELEWVDYTGKVYCLEVPNHLIYVRRNGKAIWCGNSINFVRYKVDGEIDIWTDIPIGGYASLLEAVHDFDYIFNNTGALTVRLQVEDNVGTTSDDFLMVTVTQYTQTVNIRNSITGGHIAAVDFNPGDGSGSTLRNSPFVYSWDYGTVSLTMESAGYYSKTQNVLMDSELDLDLTMVPISYFNECKASVGWVVTSNTLVITTWLLMNGGIITSPTSCTINFKDKDGVVLYSASSSSPGVDGAFKFEKSPSGLLDEGVYRLESNIVADSVTYITLIPLNLIDRRVADFISDTHDEALGKWILDPDVKTLTLYRLDNTILKVMDLTDTTRTLPSFIGRIPQ